MRDPKSEIKETELPVADEIALHNLSFGPEPNHHGTAPHLQGRRH